MCSDLLTDHARAENHCWSEAVTTHRKFFLGIVMTCLNYYVCVFGA